MNILMKSRSSPIVGRIRLIAMIFSKPSTPYDLALKTSAMPPTLMRSSSRYFPNGTGCLTDHNLLRSAHRGLATTLDPRDVLVGGPSPWLLHRDDQKAPVNPSTVFSVVEER